MSAKSDGQKLEGGIDDLYLRRSDEVSRPLSVRVLGLWILSGMLRGVVSIEQAFRVARDKIHGPRRHWTVWAVDRASLVTALTKTVHGRTYLKTFPPVF